MFQSLSKNLQYSLDADIKSSTLPRKLKASKQKSLGRNQHAVNKNNEGEDVSQYFSYIIQNGN